MSVRNLDHFTLRAPRELLDEIRDFYCDIVGLSVGHRPPFGFPGFWLYAGSRAVLHLVEDDATIPVTGNVFDHVAFHCEDIEDHERRLTERQLGFRRSRVPGTHRTQLFVDDPAGNGVELVFTGENGRGRD